MGNLFKKNVLLFLLSLTSNVTIQSQTLITAERNDLYQKAVNEVINSDELDAEIFSVRCGKEEVYFKILLEEPNSVGVIRNPNKNYEKDIEIPEKVLYNGVTYTVTRICRLAFVHLNKKGKLSAFGYEGRIKLPRTIRVIEDVAFMGYSMIKLKDPLELPDNVEYIGDFAFARSGIKSMNLPRELKYIGAYAFADVFMIVGGFQKYKSPFEGVLRLPDNLEFVGEGAFIGRSLLKTTDIICDPALKTISDKAFSMAEGKDGLHKGKLSFVVFNDGLEVIGEKAFYGANLARLSLPSSIKSIGTNAFQTSTVSFWGYNPEDADTKILKLPEWVNIEHSLRLGFSRKSVAEYWGIELYESKPDVTTRTQSDATNLLRCPNPACIFGPGNISCGYCHGLGTMSFQYNAGQIPTQVNYGGASTITPTITSTTQNLSTSNSTSTKTGNEIQPSAPIKCGVCQGSGKMEAETANFGFSEKKWCETCGRARTNGHYHKTCISCHGKGYL